MLTFPAFFLALPGCNGITQEPVRLPESSNATEDIPGSEITIECPAGDVTLLVYDATGTRELEVFEELVASGSGIVFNYSGKGRKTAVAIAGCPFRINKEAVRLYDSIELIQMSICDENPSMPVMSDVVVFEAGEDCFLRPSQLLCTVEIAEVRNNMWKESRLENPAVYLNGANTTAELLRFDGFRQNGLSDSLTLQTLPNDVGSRTEYPHTMLYCYPNDGKEPSLGNPPTSVVLECTINGTLRTFERELPPFGRGAYMKVRYEIDSEENFRCLVF